MMLMMSARERMVLRDVDEVGGESETSYGNQLMMHGMGPVRLDGAVGRARLAAAAAAAAAAATSSLSSPSSRH